MQKSLVLPLLLLLYQDPCLSGYLCLSCLLLIHGPNQEERRVGCCQSLCHSLECDQKVAMLPSRLPAAMHPQRYAVEILENPRSLNFAQLGIFPREPRHKKRANKGSSAPTSFYYAKDIAYLAHEPVLRKLREHKSFAKRLARALGRGEWSSAKSLEENKPVYRLDHIIKERWANSHFWIRSICHAYHSIDTQHSLTQSVILMMHSA